MPIIDKKLFSRIEKELYNYHSNIQAINERREEALYSSYKPDSVSKSEGRISDPTATKAIEMSRTGETEQGRWVAVIHDTFQKMPFEYKQLIKFKYFDGGSNNAVMDKLHISQSAFYEWRENIIISILLLATQRGLIKPYNEKFQEKLS